MIKDLNSTAEFVPLVPPQPSNFINWIQYVLDNYLPISARTSSSTMLALVACDLELELELEELASTEGLFFRGLFFTNRSIAETTRTCWLQYKLENRVHRYWECTDEERKRSNTAKAKQRNVARLGFIALSHEWRPLAIRTNNHANNSTAFCTVRLL